MIRNHAHKWQQKIKFDVMIRMPYEEINECYFCQEHESGATTTESGTKRSIQDAHELLGHTRNIAKHLG